MSQDDDNKGYLQTRSARNSQADSTGCSAGNLANNSSGSTTDGPMGTGRSLDSSSDDSTETILEVSTQISHEIVDGAKKQANELTQLPLMFLRYLTNPWRFIQQTPDLKTPSWIILSVFSGLVGAAFNAGMYQSRIRFFVAILILPLGSFLSVFAMNSVLRLIFISFHNVKYRYRSGASIFAFSNFFWWSLIGTSEKFPYIALIGFFISLSISMTGYLQKLKLPKKSITLWFFMIALIHTASWLTTRYLAH